MELISQVSFEILIDGVQHVLVSSLKYQRENLNHVIPEPRYSIMNVLASHNAFYRCINFTLTWTSPSYMVDSMCIQTYTAECQLNPTIFNLTLGGLIFTAQFSWELFCLLEFLLLYFFSQKVHSMNFLTSFIRHCFGLTNGTFDCQRKCQSRSQGSLVIKFKGGIYCFQDHSLENFIWIKPIADKSEILNLVVIRKIRPIKTIWYTKFGSSFWT